jgi:hypothetical protein
MDLDPIRARRGVDCAIVCGSCGHLVAERCGDMLCFPQDSTPCGHWRGWRRLDHRSAKIPGGLWQVAGCDEASQPGLTSRLEVLPAVIECPFCRVPNLFDARELNVRSQQGLARADREWRHGRLATHSRSDLRGTVLA